MIRVGRFLGAVVAVAAISSFNSASAAPASGAKCDKLVGTWVPKLPDTDGGKRHAVVQIVKKSPTAFDLAAKFGSVNANVPGYSYIDHGSCNRYQIDSDHGQAFYNLTANDDTMNYANETWIRRR